MSIWATAGCQPVKAAKVGAGRSGLHPGRRGPPRRALDDCQEVDQASAAERVVQQVRAGSHPELQRAGVGQARQAGGRNQAAEPRGVRVGRLNVAAGDPGADPGVHAVRAHQHIGVEEGARGAPNPDGLAAFFEGVYPAAQAQVPGPQAPASNCCKPARCSP